MRSLYLVLVAVILTTSCCFWGCDFITGKSPGATPIDNQDISPVPFTDQDTESSTTEYQVPEEFSANATHAEIFIQDKTSWAPLLTMPELTSLTLHINRSISIPRSRISDLDFLKELTNLTTLSLDYRGDELEILAPISSLTNLTSLNLRARPATVNEPPFDLSILEPLKNLKSLSLDTSIVTNIKTLSSLENLISLSITINNWKSFSVLEPLKNLNSLTINAETVSFGELLHNNLNHLSIVADKRYGALDQRFLVPLANQTSLAELKLQCNIRDISLLTSLDSIVSLDLSNNSIEDISPLSSLENIVSLDLSNNNIADTQPLEYFTNLIDLNLEYNQISSISAISSSTNLIRLNLQNNQIIDISPLASLTALNDLYLSNNKIEAIHSLESLTALKTAWLCNNQIKDISSLSSINSLDELFLDGNPLNNNSISMIIPALREYGTNVFYWIAREYEWLLSLILTQELEEGEYHMYNPDMSFGATGGQAASTSFGGGKEYLIESCREQGVEVGKLFEVLLQRNQAPERMQIPSSLEDGYIIDYDNYFLSYFTDDPEHNGWQRLREENPGARAFVTISVPAYDPETGIVLVYIGWQGDWLSGSGDIYAFQYDGTGLKEIARIGLWIS